MTKTERAENDRLIKSGCAVCNRLGYEIDCRIQIHHIRRLATSKVRENAPKIALCYSHHQGVLGIHTIGRRTWEQRFGEEMSYLIREYEKGDNNGSV